MATSKISLQGEYLFGRIVKHNRYFEPDPTKFTHGAYITVLHQTDGKHAWQRKMHFPELGGIIAYMRHGDQKYFGDVFLMMGAVKFWMFRTQPIEGYLQLGSGLAITTRYFHVIHNPENAVIGSALNYSFQLKLGLEGKLHPSVRMGAAISFSHYSNSAVQLPNLGINVAGLLVGVRYFPNAARPWSYNRNPYPKPQKRHELMMKLSLSMHEMRPRGGPKYPIYGFTTNYAYYTSIIHKILAGFTLDYSQAAYDFLMYYGNATGLRPEVYSLQAGLFTGSEIMIGRVSIFFIIGAYVFDPRKNWPVYTKVGSNYYFATIGKKKTSRMFIGANVKSHVFVAQNLEMSAGVAF